MADTARITAAIISTNQAEDLHNDLDLHLQNNSLPPALPLPSCLPDTSFLLVLHLTCSTVSCLHELFPLINTAPGVRSNHLIGAPPYLAVTTQLCQTPRTVSPPGTGPGSPVPHSTSSPPTPVHHTPVRLPHLLHPFTICAHSRCLRSFALHYTSSLLVRILAACAHTPPQLKCHGGFNMPGVIHLTGN